MKTILVLDFILCKKMKIHYKYYFLLTIISYFFPQGAFSLVIEAWFSPEAEQPEGKEALIVLFTARGRQRRAHPAWFISYHSFKSLNLADTELAMVCVLFTV